MTCVVAREVDAPPGSKPVEWRLLTNRTVETLAELVELTEWYRARWEISIYRTEDLYKIDPVGDRADCLP